MKKILLVITTFLLAIGLFGCTSNDDVDQDDQGNKDEEKPTVVIGLTDWTSAIVPTEIMKKILDEMGYDVEVKEANIGVVYSGLSTGELDIYLDNWDPQQGQYLDAYPDTIEQLSPIYDEALAGFVVPNYMEDINDAEDLIGKEDLFNNEMVGIEDGDPAMDEMAELIDAYGLDLELVHSSEGAMLSVARTNSDQEEPFLVYGWHPHSMFEDMGLKLLTHEKYEDEFFSGSSVHPVVNTDLKEKSPDVYDVLDDFTISIEDMEAMIRKLDAAEDPEEVAQEWIDNNRDQVDALQNKLK